MLSKLVRPCMIICGRIKPTLLPGYYSNRPYASGGTKVLQVVHLMRNLSIIRRASTKKHLEASENISSEDYLVKADERSIRETDTGSDVEESLEGEKDVKRRMSPHRTMYGQMMKEAEPEDERAVLEYYVRKAQDSMAESDDNVEYDVVDLDKKLFFKLVDLWIQDSGETRRGHREFIQVALNNLERFNVQHEPTAFLKILECYPQSEHTGLRRNNWFKAVWQDKILDHEIGVRLFSMMQKYKVVPNDKFYDVCTDLFGVFSRASAGMRSILFWYPRLTNFIDFPVSYKDLENMNPAEVAVLGLRRVSPTLDASYDVFEVENEQGNSKLKLNCIISVQTRDQKELLKNHDTSLPVFVEGPNILFFENRRVQYFILRADPVQKKTVSTSHQLLTDKEWWVKFYGKDFKTSRSLDKNSKLFSEESFLPAIQMEEHEDCSVAKQVRARNQICQVANDVQSVEGQVYAIAATDLKSVDALRSWIYGLESCNPVLSEITVLFNEKNSFLAHEYKLGETNKS